jgi:hypothetical protein
MEFRHHQPIESVLSRLEKPQKLFFRLLSKTEKLNGYVGVELAYVLEQLSKWKLTLGGYISIIDVIVALQKQHRTCRKPRIKLKHAVLSFSRNADCKRKYRPTFEFKRQLTFQTMTYLW